MTLSVNYMQGRNVSPRDDRNLIYALVSGSAGVLERGDFKVTAAATGLRVLVNGGDAFITGDSIARQGSYHVWSDAQATVQLANAPAAGTRFDLICLQVTDPEYDSAAAAINLLYLQGTVGAGGPVSTDAQPGTVYVLAMVEVRAGVTTIADARITDRRELVRTRDPLAFRVVQDIGQGVAATNPRRDINMPNIRLDRLVDMLESVLYLNLDYPVGERSDLTFTVMLDYVGTPPAGTPGHIDAIGDLGWASPNVQSTATAPGRQTVVIPAVFDNVPPGVWSPTLRVQWSGSAPGTFLRKVLGVLKPLRQGPVT